MDAVKILRIVFEGLPLYGEKSFEFNFSAMDRVNDPHQVFPILRHVYTQKIIAIAGINASGKTTALKLLHFAMNVVLENQSLNSSEMLGKSFLGDHTRMTVYFYYQDSCFMLCSDIGKNAEDRLFYKEEWLRKKSREDVKTRKSLFDFSQSDVIQQRSQLNAETLSVLHDDDSIVIKATRGNKTALVQAIVLTNMNLCMTLGHTPVKILQAFDPNLEELTAQEENGERSYTIKFRNQENRFQVHTPSALSEFISSGTIKGQNLMAMICVVLQSGGYLMVDELENHLNKALVQMILDIFNQPKMNPHGACLVFTTHYTEILDMIDRKDNIYITRRERKDPKALEVLNYSDEVRRNDVKKSEVFLSNYIPGTAPSYENIRALENQLCRES